jgi:hypothetical protein
MTIATIFTFFFQVLLDVHRLAEASDLLPAALFAVAEQEVGRLWVDLGGRAGRAE